MTTEKDERNDEPKEQQPTVEIHELGEDELEVSPRTVKEVRKLLRAQLEGLIEAIKNTRLTDQANRKWVEKRLLQVESELVDLRVEVKKLKGKKKSDQAS